MLTQQIKAGLRSTLPGTYAALQEKWTDRRLRRIQKFITHKHGLGVHSGPFKDMLCVPMAVRSFLPKVLGSYERELHDTIETIIGGNYKTVVNVGCAEGYYAIGLARRMPRAAVYAFDISSAARELCAKMAQLNAVSDRVSIEGECDVKRLNQLSGPETIIVCDCEGCELPLLDPDLVPALTESSLLVELHDFINPDISPMLCARFGNSHDITLVNSIKADPAAYPLLKSLRPTEQHLAVAEFRPDGMQWAFMKPKETSR